MEFVGLVQGGEETTTELIMESKKLGFMSLSSEIRLHVIFSLNKNFSTILSPFLIDFISGFAGGTALVTCSQPLDTVKTKLQTYPQKYNFSMTNCFKQTYKSEKLVGLYRGSLPAIFVNGGENAILFLGYEYAQRILEPKKTFEYALCGSLSAVFSSVWCCPTELLKCRLQAARESGYSTKLKDVTKQVMKEKGGLFQGLTATWIREIPGYFFFFYGKEFVHTNYYLEGLRKKLKGKDGIQSVISGTLAGIIYWLAVLPIDNVKTRIQVYGSGRSFSEETKYTWKHNKSLFYAGLVPTVLRAIPANVALFYAYDKCSDFLKND